MRVSGRFVDQHVEAAVHVFAAEQLSGDVHPETDGFVSVEGRMGAGGQHDLAGEAAEHAITGGFDLSVQHLVIRAAQGVEQLVIYERRKHQEAVGAEARDLFFS